MATRTRSKPAPRTRLTPPMKVMPVAPPVRARPVLVATDGSRSAAAAIKFAHAMEDAGAWRPEAMTVIEHLPVAVADVALPAPVILDYPDFTAGPIHAVKRQLQRLGGKSWAFRSELGSPAGAILDTAKQRNVEMIVLGLGKHGKLARLFGAETAARVCRHSDVPVLAVAHGTKERPDTIVVAMDFGNSSVRAGREALELLGPKGRLHLLHVRWALEGHQIRDEAWERTYALGVEQGFLRLTKELQRPNVKILSELRLGGVLETILKVAKEIDADVIAVGSHNQNLVDRMLLGSTPAYLLRAAKCSILVAPPMIG